MSFSLEGIILYTILILMIRTEVLFLHLPGGFMNLIVKEISDIFLLHSNTSHSLPSSYCSEFIDIIFSPSFLSILFNNWGQDLNHCL